MKRENGGISPFFCLSNSTTVHISAVYIYIHVMIQKESLRVVECCYLSSHFHNKVHVDPVPLVLSTEDSCPSERPWPRLQGWAYVIDENLLTLTLSIATKQMQVTPVSTSSSIDRRLQHVHAEWLFVHLFKWFSPERSIKDGHCFQSNWLELASTCEFNSN